MGAKSVARAAARWSLAIGLTCAAARAEAQADGELERELRSIDDESTAAAVLYVAAPAMAAIGVAVPLFANAPDPGLVIGSLVLLGVSGILGSVAIGLDVDSGSRRGAWQRRSGLFDDPAWLRAAERRSFETEREVALGLYIGASALGLASVPIAIASGSADDPSSRIVVLFTGVGAAGGGAVLMAFAIALDLDSGSRRAAWQRSTARLGPGPGDLGLAVALEL